jgi:hypothetical protein
MIQNTSPDVSDARDPVAGRGFADPCNDPPDESATLRIRVFPSPEDPHLWDLSKYGKKNRACPEEFDNAVILS